MCCLLWNRTTYAKVAGKYQDILTLEQSVAELHQMFLDFALLTEQQGELLDQIEFRLVVVGFSIRLLFHSSQRTMHSFFSGYVIIVSRMRLTMWKMQMSMYMKLSNTKRRSERNNVGSFLLLLSCWLWYCSRRAFCRRDIPTLLCWSVNHKEKVCLVPIMRI